MAVPSPVRRTRLAEHVTAQIIELIRKQGMQRGDRLPSEGELMARMEVGRSSVREALRGLSVLGLIEIRQGHGTFVKAIAPSQGIIDPRTENIVVTLARGVTDELLEAREVIEVRMAGLAAQRATAEDLAELARLIDQARVEHAGGRSTFRLGAEFHLGVARASHNDVLEGFVNSYGMFLSERGVALDRLPGYTEWEVREHDAIRDAIACRDARLAASRMRNHLQYMTIHFEHLAGPATRASHGRRHRVPAVSARMDEHAGS